eukprot:TRINITY_DN4872_c0_g1_i8.p1 TRINITY_DN4872_c0_g1~~TRINITY_DN4872_c0_g1_i8.p1  ORF type:complete len:345 (-),score=60.73 TRINITY_DN4872_c0_g1_i8:362-1396(-)
MESTAATVWFASEAHSSDNSIAETEQVDGAVMERQFWHVPSVQTWLRPKPQLWETETFLADVPVQQATAPICLVSEARSSDTSIAETDQGNGTLMERHFWHAPSVQTWFRPAPHFLETETETIPAEVPGASGVTTVLVEAISTPPSATAEPPMLPATAATCSVSKACSSDTRIAETDQGNGTLMERHFWHAPSVQTWFRPAPHFLETEAETFPAEVPGASGVTTVLVEAISTPPSATADPPTLQATAATCFVSKAPQRFGGGAAVDGADGAHRELMRHTFWQMPSVQSWLRFRLIFAKDASVCAMLANVEESEDIVKYSGTKPHMTPQDAAIGPSSVAGHGLRA